MKLYTRRAPLALLAAFALAIATPAFAQDDPRVVEIRWEEVVEKSIDDNLALRAKRLDYESQDLEEWKSLSTFLPTLSYQGAWTNNQEIPKFFIAGQVIEVGSPWTIQHNLVASLPLFTGGARWFNYEIQSDLRKSMAEEVRDMESETALNALKAYFGVVLAQEMEETMAEAVEVAEANLEQVRTKRNVGTATELDLQRAKAQYFAQLPQYESAKNGVKKARQQLKVVLNIPLEDSLAIMDTLAIKTFGAEYVDLPLEELKSIARESRPDLRAGEYQVKAAEGGETAALSRFSPTAALSYTVSHQTQAEELDEDGTYFRTKALALSVSWSLFEGGGRYLDWEKAAIRTRQAELYRKLADDQAALEVENARLDYLEAVVNLESLEAASAQAEEASRLANLLYGEGMSAQLDVLNAQLAKTQSRAAYLEGVYRHNVSRLTLLDAVGKLNAIWE
jgi:outer membrane protein